MDIIKWRDSFETGVPSMDEEHRQLIELINTMYKVMRNKQSPEVISDVLNKMQDYGRQHLENEEKMMQETGYDRFAEHVELHKQYLERMDQLLVLADGKNEEINREVYHFLRNWWTGHIIKEDKLYGPEK